MKARIAAGLIGAALIMGTAIPSFSGQSGSSTERNITRDQAIKVANKAKPGTVTKASLEKRDNQVVWEVRIDKSIIQVNSQTGDIIKTIDNTDSN